MENMENFIEKGNPLEEVLFIVLLNKNEELKVIAPYDIEIIGKKMWQWVALAGDGTKIKIARGVNSLTEFTENKSSDFAKIKIVEAVDMIRDDIRNTFEDEFVGKVENSYDNKIVFIAAVNKYFKDLASRGVLYDQFDNKAEIDIDATREWLSQTKDVSSWDDEKIKTANTGTNVFVKANIQIQDAIEDLNFRIYIE